jgi:hypothetical protein
MNRILLVILFSFSLSAAFSQDSTAAQSKGTSYYKIEVGIIIDCPVLTMRVHDKLIAVNGIKDYSKNREKQNITFNLPEGTLTKEQVQAIAVSCGFPAQSINIVVDNKPFGN